MSELEVTKLSEEVMLVKITIRRWSPVIADTSVSNDVAQRNNSDPALGRYYKRLLTSPSLKDFEYNELQAREYNKNVTVPFADGHFRMLPNANFFSWRDKISEFSDKAANFASKFAYEELDQAVADAQTNLGSLFDVGNYPKADDVFRKFAFESTVMPLPNNSNWVVDKLNSAQIELEEIYQRQLTDSLVAAKEDVLRRIHSSLTPIVERFSQPDKRFKRTIIENVANLVDLLPSLNITNDPELNKLTEELSLKVASINAQKVRDDVNLRKIVSDDANRIVADTENILKNMGLTV